MYSASFKHITKHWLIPPGYRRFVNLFNLQTIILHSPVKECQRNFRTFVYRPAGNSCTTECLRIISVTIRSRRPDNSCLDSNINVNTKELHRETQSENQSNAKGRNLPPGFYGSRGSPDTRPQRRAGPQRQRSPE